MSSKEKFASKMEFPPQTEQPNVYPLTWISKTKKMEEIWEASQREYWDPAKLPWDTFDVESYTWEERECIAYWWTLLSVFDASAPPVFAAAMIKTYEDHEEDPVRRCFFSVTRDEQNHEQVCGMFITKLLGHPDPLTYEPKTEIGKKAQKNTKWLYFNGGRYWDGYKKAVPRYSLAVLFSSFLMGEIASSTIFHQMANGNKELVFKEAFKNIGRDEGRHMAICMSLMERDYPKLQMDDRKTITKQIRAGYLFLSAVLFEPPTDFWDLPSDFIEVQREIEANCRNAGFFIPEYEQKKENWRNAILNLKGVLDKYDIPFPAIPEVGITGEEIRDVDMDDIIPVF
ncbi:MAG: hypothetical protein COW00_04470 [Bdellovibrio sp. CG12_big_fil_rev_8_21_14_0_65_39_13]|nr:MAG: hypothetical protein COW78_12670 [Bdellovibrio sp. CG22_combo_CG10-13_8_21_14_all_39_27]PIQ61063.1 MAG: hypothetical protein COW00_04470 [Bdellovibrio sp. CG12_big_fil_rev_8_21_14_0_65_39_13]PIR36831.1 MAG: hypothetical protein COV37_01490 [Bdellovibrio sp. CG11_big_fil_rev_8_21_14_0_20_39_38]